MLLALGLGFDAETPGLMQRPPRPPGQPVIPRALGARLAFAGLLIAVGTLIVVAWGEDRHGLDVATTMGLTTLALLHIVAALEWRDPFNSIFRHETFANRRFNLLMLATIVLTYLATSLGALNRLLGTVPLDGQMWRVCLLATLGYLVLAELGKFVLRRLGHRHA